MKDIFEDYGAGIGCLAVVLMLVLVLVLCAFEAWLVMLLWNGVLCALFTAFPAVTFWQAWGVLILCNLLFKSTHFKWDKDD